MTTEELIAQFEGRKRALLSGEHYTTEPLTKDHRDDILRWVYDLDEAIAALKVGCASVSAGEASASLPSAAPDEKDS